VSFIEVAKQFSNHFNSRAKRYPSSDVLAPLVPGSEARGTALMERFLELDKPQDLGKKIQQINAWVEEIKKALADVNGHLSQEALPAFLQPILPILMALSLVEQDMNRSFWRAINEVSEQAKPQIKPKEMNVLRMWFDLIARLKNSLNPVVNLFDFIDVPGSSRAIKFESVFELRKAYSNFCLSSPERFPSHDFAQRLIQPSKISEPLDPDFLDWQHSISRYLEDAEKTKLQRSYEASMDLIDKANALGGCLSVSQSAIVAVLREVRSEIDFNFLSGLSKEEKAQHLDKNKAKVFGVYNHFAMLLARYSPISLLQFDRKLQAQDSGVTFMSFDQKFQEIFSSIFSEGHFINKNSGRIPSPSLRKEYIKFLLIQQWTFTAGAAFDTNANKAMVIQYFAQHRTWWGKLANKLFGYKTDSQRICDEVEALRVKNPDLAQQQNSRFSQSIEEKIRAKVENWAHRLGIEGVTAERAFLLKERFPDLERDRQKQTDFGKISSVFRLSGSALVGDRNVIIASCQ
jgi:hypothetical protein